MFEQVLSESEILKKLIKTPTLYVIDFSPKTRLTEHSSLTPTNVWVSFEQIRNLT